MASTILEQILENVSRGARLPRNGHRAAPAPAPPPEPAAQAAAPAEEAAPEPAPAASVAEAGALMRQVIEEMDNRLSSMVDQVLNHPALGKTPGSAPTPAPSMPPVRSGFQAPAGVSAQTEAIDPTRVTARPAPSLGVATEAIDPSRVPAAPPSVGGQTEAMDPGRIAMLQEQAKRARAIAANAEAAKRGTLRSEEPSEPAAPEPENATPVPTEALPPAGPMTPVEPVDPKNSSEALLPSASEPELAPGELEPSTKIDVDEVWEESQTDRSVNDSVEDFVAEEASSEEATREEDPPVDFSSSTETSASVEDSLASELAAAAAEAQLTEETVSEPEPAFDATTEMANENAAVTPAQAAIEETRFAEEDGEGERLLDLIQVPTSPSPPTISPALQDSTVIEQVEAIVEEIAATCGTGTDFADDELVEDEAASPALQEIRDLLAPLQSVPALLEKAGAPQQQILRQMQALAEEVRDLSRAPRPAGETTENREVAEQAQERRRVAIDDIQGMIQSLS